MVRKGFTLVEIVIGLAIAAILLNFAMSAWESATQAARSSSARSALLAALTRARSTAAMWGADVGLCPSADGTRCDDSEEWHRGWVVFADRNDSNLFDAGDSVLIRGERAGDGVRIVTSRGRTYLEFQGTGGNEGSNATFTFCDRRGPARATSIVMGNAGTYREARPGADASRRACAAGPGPA